MYLWNRYLFNGLTLTIYFVSFVVFAGVNVAAVGGRID